MKFNSITICPVRSLEVGDLIAKEFFRTVVSGRITGVVYAAYQLTPEQRQYMMDHNLDIPEDEYAPLGGSAYTLLFGEFSGSGRNANQPNHMYVSLESNVALFPTN